MKQKLARVFLLSTLLVVGLFVLVIFRPHLAKAAISNYIGFQGKLANNPDGTNVTNNTYSVVFTIYTVSDRNCTSPSQVWQETQSVTTVDGLFQVNLGSVTALPGSVDFNGSLLCLGVKVGADAEMSPKIFLTASPYAYNSEKLDGLDSTGFVQLAQGLQADSSTTNVSIAINKTGATAGILQLQRAGSDVMTIGNNGSYAYTMSAANNPTYTITNNGSGNVITNLAGTGNFVIQDGGTAFATFSNTGAITFAPTAATNVVVNEAAGSNFQVVATAPPTVDQLVISNAGQPVTTNGVSGLQINYVGGAGAIEGSGARIDLTPGATSGSTWNGIRIVANATGAVSGVVANGIKLEGPTSPGAGSEVAMVIDANWDAGLQMGVRTVDPDAPPADNIYVYARKIAGRSILRQQGSSGVAFAFQPALFEQAITYQGPNTGTTVTAFGSSWTVDSTASHPAATEVYGFATNFATAATSADTTGVAEAAVQHFRGTVAGASNGFFYVARLGLPDASYGAGATGTRIWTGLTNQTAVTMSNSDNPAGHFTGFQYSTNRGDANWQFMTKDNATQNVINTQMVFAVNKVYDFYVYVAPLGTTIYWRIDNLTDGTTQVGNTSANLPAAGTALRAGTNMRTLTTTARNIRVLKHYVEADR